MVNKARPLSPHLQVYKLPLPALLSITHRLTGVLLSLGMLVFVLWLLALSSSPQAIFSFHHFFQQWYGQVLLFAWVFAFFYHFCNGVRHLFWDVGKGLSMPAVYRSGYLALLAAALLTLGVFLLI